jgi:hypothetical protein
VHPNAAGARYIAETIFEYVLPIARAIDKDAVTIPDTR